MSPVRNRNVELAFIFGVFNGDRIAVYGLVEVIEHVKACNIDRVVRAVERLVRKPSDNDGGEVGGRLCSGDCRALIAGIYVTGNKAVILFICLDLLNGIACVVGIVIPVFRKGAGAVSCNDTGIDLGVDFVIGMLP